MADFFPFLIFGVIFTLVVGVILYSIYAEKKRREILEETATDLGLTFYKDGDDQLFELLNNFKLFNQGRARKMRNLIQGDSGEVKIAIFDYQYTTGSGKNSSTYRMTIAALQSAELNCPDFTMRPEGFFDRIGSALGFQDIDFDTHPEFSSKFVLQSSQEEAVRKYFQSELLEFFQTKPGISVEAQPGMMFFYQPGKRVKPAEIKDLLAQTYEVFGYMVDK